MTKKFYKVTGIDRANNDLYRLGYTGDIEKCSEYHIENGWNREDLVFERFEQKEIGGK